MNRRGKTTIRQRGTLIRPPRMNPDLIAELAYRLTPRDRAILTLIWEHRVLTTDQLTAMYFPTPERARQRLNQLHHLHALLRFRPWTPVGSRPWHWVLGPAGAHTLAIENSQTLTEFGYRQDAAVAIAVSPRLGHQIGVNDFFVHLHTHARHQGDGTTLTHWWPEHRCTALWGDLARPDAYGRWTQPTPGQTGLTTLDFFLEHDTGTEPLTRVAAKLADYADLAETTGTTTPVLFWLPSPRRETNLRTLLGTPEIPATTAVHTTASEGPAGPIWQAATTTGPRRRLIDLAHIWQVTQRPDIAPSPHATKTL